MPARKRRKVKVTCDCKQHERLAGIMRGLPEDDQAFLESIYSNLMHAETDAVYYRLKLEGKWPGDDQSVYVGCQSPGTCRAHGKCFFPDTCCPQAAAAAREARALSPPPPDQIEAEGRATGWIATGPFGRVAHFSKIDGWDVQAVTFAAKEPPG
jgi:hypothetical protein